MRGESLVESTSVSTARGNVVFIVAGLPRSGTSMMMKMLECGGLPVLTDNARIADDDNPNGYYEFEAVKKVKADTSWVAAAVGRVVKMVYSLLYDLPEGFEYRVVFMRRNLDEVLASQKTMLQRKGLDDLGVDDASLKRLFDRELRKVEEWLARKENFRTLYVDYNALQRDPVSSVGEISQFFSSCLNTDAMISVVDPALYRNRR